MNNTIDEGNIAPEQSYARRLNGFKKYYRNLIILCGVTVAFGIFVAVMSNVLVGMAICLLSASAYIYFSADGAYRMLGLRFKNTDGAVCITRLCATCGESAVIPARLIYADVRSIGDGALKAKKNAALTRVYIPRTIEKIGKDILPVGGTLTICFEGTREEWERIESATDFGECELYFECTPETETEEEK